MKYLEGIKLGKLCLVSAMLLGLTACATANDTPNYYNYQADKITPTKYIISFDSDSLDDARKATQETAEKLIKSHFCTSFKINELGTSSQNKPVDKSTVSPNNFIGNPFLYNYAREKAEETMYEPDYVQIFTVKSQIDLIGCQK